MKNYIISGIVGAAVIILVIVVIISFIAPINYSHFSQTTRCKNKIFILYNNVINKNLIIFLY